MVDFNFADSDVFEYGNQYTGTSSANLDDATQQAFEAATSTYGYLLALNGVDRTPQLDACHEQTGYRDPIDGETNQVSNDTLMAMLEMGVKWAQCARDNGWTQVTDPQLPNAAPDNPIYPVVFLPTDITSEQLQQLVGTCPTIDRANPTDMRPNVTFDYPGLSLRPSTLTYNGDDDPEYQRLGALMTILYDPADENVDGGQGGG
jgi:hypothetical protein